MMVAWFRAGTYQNKSRHSFLMRLVNRRASLRLLCRDRVRDSGEFHRGTQLLTKRVNYWRQRLLQENQSNTTLADARLDLYELESAFHSTADALATAVE